MKHEGHLKHVYVCGICGKEIRGNGFFRHRKVCQAKEAERKKAVKNRDAKRAARKAACLKLWGEENLGYVPKPKTAAKKVEKAKSEHVWKREVNHTSHSGPSCWYFVCVKCGRKDRVNFANVDPDGNPHECPISKRTDREIGIHHLEDRAKVEAAYLKWWDEKTPEYVPKPKSEEVKSLEKLVGVLEDAIKLHVRDKEELVDEIRKLKASLAVEGLARAKDVIKRRRLVLQKVLNRDECVSFETGYQIKMSTIRTCVANILTIIKDRCNDIDGDALDGYQSFAHALIGFLGHIQSLT